jgi:DNA-binding XRE family transcriptional regulator
MERDNVQYEAEKEVFPKEPNTLLREGERQHEEGSLKKAEGIPYKELKFDQPGLLYQTGLFGRPLQGSGVLIDKDIENYLNFSEISTDRALPYDEVINLLQRPRHKEQEKLSLEAFFRRTPQYSIEELEELVDKLPYEDFVSLTYRSLERRGKTPIDLTYDLLNEMARELYESALSATKNRKFDFRERPGEEIRVLRQHLGISQRQLARALNFSSSTPLRDVENEKYTPTLKKIYEFLEALGSLR